MDCLEGEDMHVWKGKTWMSARARHGCLEGQDMDVWKGKTWMSGRARHGCLEGQDMDVWKGKTWMSGRGRHGFHPPPTLRTTPRTPPPHYNLTRCSLHSYSPPPFSSSHGSSYLEVTRDQRTRHGRTRHQKGQENAGPSSGTGWLRLVGSLKLKVSFAEYHLFCRALLQKRPMILRSLLIVASP